MNRDIVYIGMTDEIDGFIVRVMWQMSTSIEKKLICKGCHRRTLTLLKVEFGGKRMNAMLSKCY